LKDRIGILAVQDALDVELDDRAVVADGANETDVVKFALEVELIAVASMSVSGEYCVRGMVPGVLKAPSR
jgi:hypothetical protein